MAAIAKTHGISLVATTNYADYVIMTGLTPNDCVRLGTVGLLTAVQKHREKIEWGSGQNGGPAERVQDYNLAFGGGDVPHYSLNVFGVRKVV